MRTGLVRFMPMMMLLSSAGGFAVAAKPQIVFETARWDFGVLQPGKVLEKRFVLNNPGDAPLRVKDVDVSCGCVTATLDRVYVAAGETANLDVEVDTSKRSGKGEVRVRVSAMDDVASTLVLKYDIQGPPTPVLLVANEPAPLGLLVAGETVEREITVRNGGMRELVIHDFSAWPGREFAWQNPLPQFPLRLPPATEQVLRFSITPREPYGLYHKSVVLNSNDGKNSKTYVTMSAYVASKAELQRVLRRNGEHRDE